MFSLRVATLGVHTRSLLQSTVTGGLTGQVKICRNDEYRSSKGHCCNKCFPGFKLVNECVSEHHRSHCDKCPPENYLDNSNSARTCFRCKRCKEENYENETSPCTGEKNRVCDCVDGYYKKEISPTTWQCLKCRTCGDGQQELSKCVPNSNTVCVCKEDHYENTSGQCVPCKTCLGGDKGGPCSQYCNRTTEEPTELPALRGRYKMPFVTLSVIFAVIVGGLCAFICLLYKRSQKSQWTSSVAESPSSMTTESLMGSETHESKIVRQENSPGLGKSELSTVQSQLPDCVPREFNASQFIYFLLEHIPLDRFKELVRCLGVSDRDIERVERENHSVKEAQYQMLRMWSENGSGGKPGSLSHAGLVLVVDTLRNIGLVGCAEAVEDKYEIQQA
ncbi:tumor necrosis factor receptor superfamily member 1A [Arapaima gigas]